MGDLRYGLRSFRRHPVVTAVAVLSLAMGIGVTTAVFGLIDAVVLKPLPVSKPDRLVTPTVILPQGAFDNFSFAQFEQFRNAPSLSSLCAWSPDRFDTQWTGQSESVPGQYVSPEYFDTLEIAPAIGNFPIGSEAAQAGSVVNQLLVLGIAVQRQQGSSGPASGYRECALYDSGRCSERILWN